MSIRKNVCCVLCDLDLITLVHALMLKMQIIYNKDDVSFQSHSQLVQLLSLNNSDINKTKFSALTV